MSFFSVNSVKSQIKETESISNNIIVGAERMNQYLPLLKGKRVALLANQTSLVNGVNLLDTLLKLKVNVVKLFGPEHGFRGQADAGVPQNNSIDPITGIPIVSLFGKHEKPDPNDLKGVDVMVYDIQDVGVHFYTYINTMQYFMEAAAENNKKFIILDRPNPIGFYVDGPVLEKGYESLVGLQPVPVVYGMTIGEYAKMLKGEKWINNPGGKLDMTIIKCLNYTHDSLYQLPIKPSPNLPNMASVYLYPSLCFFEGTVLSEGRGTAYPFQLFGHPSLPKNLYSFVPKSTEGAHHPKFEGDTCYGFLVANSKEEALTLTDHELQLRWLLEAYNLFPDKNSFFGPRYKHFDLLAGTDKLRKQIEGGWSEKKIRASWEPELSKFKKIRKKYLLYPDFTKK